MLFIFSMPVLIRCLWQLKTVVLLHWCLICAVLLAFDSIGLNPREAGNGRGNPWSWKKMLLAVLIKVRAPNWTYRQSNVYQEVSCREN